MNETTVPIILTKLQPPLTRRTAFPRERLAPRVRECVERRLTLVCAAPGYGKTTLIASSLAELHLPVVWYSLSRSDRDIITFFSYLAAGFDRQWPGLAEAVRPTFAPGKDTPAQLAAFVAAWVNQMALTAQGDFLVIFDDFQLVDTVPEICEALDLLITHAPSQAHFVIATRAAPPFACLPRLRAEGQAVEINETDLKFDPVEAAMLFVRCLKLNVPEAHVAALTEQTEGWALGLLMAGQSIKGRGQLDEALSAASALADRRILFEYLSEEVMRQQPPALADFLTSSAILSRLEPHECDAALGRFDSAAHLQRLEQHCLFVARTEDGCLRYHRLFREFLLQQLAGDRERAEALHQRAAAYFEEKQNIEAAIFHRLEAHDYRQAARLITAVSPDMLHAGRFDTLGFWLGQLPESEFAEFPALWMSWGQMSEARSRWDAALDYYDRAAQAYTARGDLLGLSDVLQRKGHILNWREGRHAEAERLHREALSYVGEAHRRKRAALLAGLARDQLAAGNTVVAETLYREALAIYEAEADPPGQLETLLNPGSWLFHSKGEFQQALAVLRRAEQLARELNSPRHLVEAHNNMAVNLYFLGRFVESLRYAGQALAFSRELGDTHGEAFALMNQANGLEATCGASYTDLYRQYQRALHMQQALGNHRFVIATLVFMMILARRSGDVSEAAQRGGQALSLAAERGLRWLAGFAQIQLGAAQIWIDPAAQATLDEALQTFGDCGDHYHLAASHFWLAAVYQFENNLVYLDHLRECLKLAVGHHHDSFFRAEAQAAIPLLVAALEHDLWPAYVAPILAQLGPRTVGSIQPLLGHPDEAVRQRARSLLEQMGVSLSPAPPRRRPASVPPLTIRGFGPFTVLRAGGAIEERDWGRRKCKRLFKYLVLSPGYSLPKDTLVDLLWGDADPQAANANFYRTLYNLRRVLEPLAPHSGANYLALEGGQLRLVGEVVKSVDVTEFVRSAEEGRRMARAGHPEASDRLAAAVQLYTDDLSTDDLYDDWLRPQRDYLRDLYLGALRDLADLAMDVGQLDLAIGFLQQAFRKDGTGEAACLSLMTALARAGRRVEALQCYSACEKALAEIGLSPSDELSAAHRGLLGTPLPFWPSSPSASPRPNA